MSGHRASEPWGRTAAFANAVAAKMGADFANAWLGAHCCRFSDTTVFTTGLGAARLGVACEKEIAECGVAIAVCADVTAALYRELDARANEAKPARGRK